MTEIDNMAYKFDEFIDYLHDVKSHGISDQSAKIYRNMISSYTPDDIRFLNERLTIEERQFFTWINFSCLDYDTALQILNNTVIERAVQKEKQRLDAEYRKRNDQFDSCKKHIYKELNKRNRRILELESKVCQLKNHNAALSYSLKRMEKLMKCTIPN